MLQSFCESRETSYVHEPYRGGPVDGPQNGMPPPPCSVPCVADGMFRTYMKILEVPHTSSVQVNLGVDNSLRYLYYNEYFRVKKTQQSPETVYLTASEDTVRT